MGIREHSFQPPQDVHKPADTIVQFSIIVTIRLIMFSSAAIISGYNSLAATYPCVQIDSVLGEDGTLALYPGCGSYYNGLNPEQRVVVSPDFESKNPIEIAAALGISFGTAGWLALWIHAVIVEVYVRLARGAALTETEVNLQKCGS